MVRSITLWLVVSAIWSFCYGRFSLQAAEPPQFKQVGLCYTGFGVPGSGRPLVLGNQVLLNAGEGYPTVYDCTDPRRPRIQRFIPTWFFTTGIYPLVARDLTYLSNSRGRLLVLEGLKNMAERGDVKEIPWDGSWGRAFLSGLRPDGIGYTVVEGHILVLDLGDPRQPRLVTKIAQPRLKPVSGAVGAHLLVFTEDYRFAALMLDSGTRIGLLRWKSPTEPELCGELENVTLPNWKNPVHGRVEALDERRLVIAHPASAGGYWRSFKLGFWDTSDPQQPRRAGQIDLGSSGTHIRDVVLAGDYGYVLDGREIASGHGVSRKQRSRLLVLDVKDLSAPKIATQFVEQMPTEYSRMTLAGRTLYVNDYNYGLWLFDVGDPQRPVKLGGAPASAEGHWLYLNGNHAYMGHTFGGTIHVIDVGDPQRPKTVGYYWDGQWLNYKARIAGRGPAMYLPQSDGMAIVDVRQPVSPNRVGEFLDPEQKPLREPCIALLGGHAYVTASAQGKSPPRLLVYDIAQPLEPRRAAAVELPAASGYRVLAVEPEKMLYLVAYGGKRIVAVDAADPARPQIAADLAAEDVRIGDKKYSMTIKDGGGNGAPGVAFAKGFLYVTTSGEAPGPYLLVFDVRDCAAIRPAGVLEVTDRRGWQYFACDVIADGDRLYLGDYGCEEAYDLADPLSPRRIAGYRRAYSWQVGVLRAGLLYVPKLDGLEILAVPDAAATRVDSR